MTPRPPSSTRRTVLQALAVLACPGAKAAQDDSATGPLRFLSLGDIGGLAVVDGEASGPDGKVAGAWLLDTGAEVAVMDAHVAKSLGLRRRGTRTIFAPGGRTVAPDVEPPRLRLGSTDLELQEATVLDLGAHGAAAGEPVLGIVGWPTLLASPWRLELAAGRWRRGDPVVQPPIDALNMPWRKGPGLPVVDGRLNERQPLALLLDTGFAGALMLWGDEAAALGSAAGSSATIEVQGIGGSTVVKAVLLSRLRIGQAAWTDVPALLLHASPLGSAPALNGVTGAVGMALFENAALGFDAARRNAWTTAGVDMQPPGGFGVVLTTAGNRLVAQQVLAGSPAAKAGIRAGDELFAIDGTPPSRPIPPAAWGPLRGRKTADLEWRRGDTCRTTTLTRERFFARAG